jgi:hypothetical protein
MVTHPHEWKSSSYLATVLKESKPIWLHIDTILCLFSEDDSTAIQRYEEFVTEGARSNSPWRNCSKARSEIL